MRHTERYKTPRDVRGVLYLRERCLGLFSVLGANELLDGAKCAGGDAHALSVDADNLKVDVLATSRRDVGVTSRIAEDGTLSTQLADTGHRGWAMTAK